MFSTNVHLSSPPQTKYLYTPESNVQGPPVCVIRGLSLEVSRVSSGFYL
uniref:Uncharacterized protein n=1 Tax=Anguilla anguilla TaxID=7936 RepID=A0A0E9SV45_ANGAN